MLTLGIFQGPSRKLFDSGEYFLAKEGKHAGDAFPVPATTPAVIAPFTYSPALRKVPGPSRLGQSRAETGRGLC
jgi:hypothetical protein